jgi:predicted DNA repair protein MutK
MKSLAVLGTAAMFLVGGGILVHGLPPVYELLHHLQELAHGVAAMGGLLSGLVMVLFNGLFGILAGGLVLGVVSLFSRLRRGTV